VSEAEAWQETVGEGPWKVTAIERHWKGGALYLRWRERRDDGRTDWRYRSLGRTLRTQNGRIIAEAARFALAEALKLSEALKSGTVIAAKPVSHDRPLTIAEGIAVAIDPERGKYPVDTMHRRETLRELQFAKRVWGQDTPWERIRRAELRQLWRKRILALRADGHEGLRGAEIAVQRVLAVAQWLRDEERIPAHACVAPRRWRDELRADWRVLAGEATDAEPHRPRHTLEEMRKILEVADQVDPRFGLMIALGAELRLGQVRRARRRDLDLERSTFVVRSAGKKRGVVVHLTEGQRAVLDAALAGYLRTLEEAFRVGTLADYPLFPAGQMPGGRKGQPVATVERHSNGKVVNPRWVLDSFKEAERLAEVPHIEGRAAYGLRRAAVDAAKEAGISREGLQAHGGWTDSQIPDRVYADQQAGYARDEARRVRAKIRGEE
jgi:integrase